MGCDVIVVGAGAAGLAAGMRLREVGLATVVLEARDRIGGRAWTDDAVFPGMAFDRGAHWLHSASQNPFVAVADRLGFRYRPEFTYKSRHLFTGGGAEAGQSHVSAARMALGRALDRIEAGEFRAQEASIAGLLDEGDPWHRLTWRTLSQMLAGDPDQCSAEDFARYQDTGEDFPVEDGYGALVAAHAAGLPVELSTPALGIDWSGRGVRVETRRGTLQAQAAIVTAPSSILASGRIRFHPLLPNETEAAFHDCPLGSFEKIAILLDRPLDGWADAYGDVIDGPPIGRDPVNIAVQPFGWPLLILHVAGRAGRALEAQGAAATRAAGVEVAVHAFGSDVRKRIVKVETTRWSSDPWSLGSYSFCRPGRAGARDAFDTPVADRIHFAGEHAWPRCFATVHGAHLSGHAAAERVIAALSSRLSAHGHGGL